ncbi:MAG: Gfo/Idh/MocA family oxidoreductase [Bacteroidales bacterium]|nr:Gfo/Idh/MocA family oxidoreductase [Bacteroidales bacterium]MCF8327928.1 Gfo/Idh/MocA family oxidoreductase [Bacteroidales bacterium]
MKIGILGVGYIGKIHLKCLNNLPNFEIVGFYDIDDIRSEQIASEFGIKRYKNYLNLIDDSEAISILTPTSTHFEYAKAAITRSRHVFIEKPLVDDAHQAEELIKLAEEAEIKVQVGHVERFNQAFISVEKHLDNPMFIESHRLSDFTTRGLDIPVVYDLMIHDIDIILGVVNSFIKRISASGVPVISNTPDIANARIEFDNGAVANLTASRISMKKMRKTRFFQSNAVINVDFLSKKSEIIKMQNNSLEETPQPQKSLSIPGIHNNSFNIYEPEITEINAIQTELEYFYKSIKQDKQPLVSINDGYNALYVAQKIMEKIEI